MLDLKWIDKAWDEYVEIQNEDKRFLRKINQLIKDIRRNGLECQLGKPEPLVGDLAGLWSVRVNQKDRLLFRIIDETVDIISCRGHYGDK